MTAITYTVSFKKTVLASVIGLFLSQSCFALQEISDEKLSETTGEGIAFLPENFSYQFNGTDNTQGAGYIRIIPVGPITDTAKDTNKDGFVNTSDHSVGKADIYLYGLALSQANKTKGSVLDSTDWNTRFGKDIVSWGTAENPWIIKVATEKNVPNFSALSSTDTGKGDISYLSFEAPLFNTTIPTDDKAGAGAYNLKLGAWADAFVRDPDKVEGDSNQFNLGQMYGNASDANRANRLRLQAILNGFSLNGSNLKLFQTLGGATNNNGMSTSYNNTLGLTGVFRINSGDSQNLRATFTAANRVEDTNWTMSDTTAYGCGSSSVAYGVAKCEYRFRSKNVTDSVTDGIWTPPSVQNVLRLSTKEKTNSALLDTPALGGAMPQFDDNEGLYLYNPNINVVLGSLYQPLTLGVAPDGKNIVIEIARLPNKESIYKQVYTDYSGADTSYKGSTCNIYQCGNNGLAGYQGNNATHSSISIGSTEYTAATNTLNAHKGNGAIGVSFGQLQQRTGITATKTYTRWQDQQRQMRQRTFNWTDTYHVSNGNNNYDPYTGQKVDGCGSFLGIGGCDRSVNNNGTWQYLNPNKDGNGAKGYYVFVPNGYHIDWIYRNSGDANTGTFNNTIGTYTDAQIATCTGNGGSSCNKSNSDRDYTGIIAPANDLDWDKQTNANWADSTAKSAAVRGVVLDNIPTSATINMSPQNNFGSAVIDGVLIQHMKITTKGL
ncbi:hypothetical protein KTH71_11725 [Acinetobacter sp. WU_MDCI_Axc73]|nr:hypothetical protein [Acinetobacter sp. WU_MDCI_Axc73]